MELTLSGNVVAANATAEDIESAVDQRPRGDDWELCLDSGADDYMEATLEEDGTFWIGTEEKLVYVYSHTPADDALLKSILLSFLHGDGRWRDLAQWKVPDPVAVTKKTTAMPDLLRDNIEWVGLGLVVLLSTLVVLGLGKWIFVLFAAAFPGIVAFVAVRKMAEARKAAGWTQGSARILKSAKVMHTSGATPGSQPAVEYEFTVGFKKHVGTRISIGEILRNSPAVDQAVARYRVGASVPVFYNPANPAQSVLERDLPKHFAAIWLFVAFLAIVCVGGAVWFVRGSG